MCFRVSAFVVINLEMQPVNFSIYLGGFYLVVFEVSLTMILSECY